MFLQQNIKEDLRVFIGSSSSPPAVAPLLHSTIIGGLVQGLCLCSARLQSLLALHNHGWLILLLSCDQYYFAVVFFIILAVAVSIFIALFVLDNC